MTPRVRPTLLSALALIATVVLCIPVAAQQQSAAQQDLARIVHEVRNNYAGYQRTAERLGADLDLAIASTMELCTSIERGEADEAIRKILALFEDGHLILQSQYSDAFAMEMTPLFSDDRQPILRALSDETTLLRIPSFAPQWKQTIEALLEEHDDTIRTRTNLVIDLRGNSGGTDLAFNEILPIVSTGAITLPRLYWRCTEENAAAIEAQLQQIPRGAEATAAPMQRLVTDMRDNLDQLTPLGAPTRYDLEPWSSPSRVALLVDRHTASSAEQLVLRARQGSKSSVYGERTFGAANHLNPRMVLLPSGKRSLLMAMSISETALKNPDGGLGIPPDHVLQPKLLRDPEAAVEHVGDSLERRRPDERH